MEIRQIEKGLFALESNMNQHQFSGFDPYDTLKSPLFKLGILKNHFSRFYGQQIGKRLPFHLQKVLGISKSVNPVTLALSYASYFYLAQIFPHRKEEFLNCGKSLFTQIMSFPTKLKENAWGYEFDWEARYTEIRAFAPNAVATGIVTNSLFIAKSLIDTNDLVKVFLDASLFITEKLKRKDDTGRIYFSYSAGDDLKVFNAHMKSVRLLSQLFSLTGSEEALDLAKKGVEFVLNHQNQDGSWDYAPNEKRNWPDNYHNAYILDCLDDYMKLSEDMGPKHCLQLGLDYYVNNFFLADGEPKKLAFKEGYVDATSVGQSLLTLARFNQTDLAVKVATWAIKNLQDKSGGFYYQKSNWHIDKRIFMRWNNAWMFAGLSFLLYKIKKDPNRPEKNN